MTARWHLGPVSDWDFWRVLAFSPEILVFLFFMITDPKTIPAGKTGRRVYAVAIGLLAALLIAPQTTEFGSKVALLAALALVCAARPMLESGRRRCCGGATGRRRTVGAAALAGAVAFVSLLVVAGIPARSSAEATVLPAPAGRARRRQRPDGAGDRADRPADGGADRARPRRRPRERVRGAPPPRPRARDRGRGRRPPRRAVAADRRGGRTARSTSRATRSTRVRVSLEPGDGQSPPLVVATTSGTVERGGATRPLRRDLRARAEGRPLPDHRRARIRRPSRVARSDDLGGVRLRDVAAEVGLDFRHAAFRFGITHEEAAMMGGGLCWLDYDDDGWLDLFVVNAYGDEDYVQWTERGGLPRSALFHNVRRPLRGRQPRLGRRPAAPRQRLRRGRLQPGRQHRPLRDDGRLQRRHERLRRAALGQRRRHLHRRRPRGRDQRAGLAQRCRRRRRQRRRPPRPLRGGLRRPERAGARRRRRVPVQRRRRARPPLPQSGHGREGPLPLPRGRQARRPRADAGRPRARGGLHATSTTTAGSTSTSRTTSTRTGST